MKDSSTKPRYDELSDESLVKLSREGSTEPLEHIFRRYLPLVKSRVATYASLGMEADDLVQEGMIGLLKAIRGFDPGRETPFRSFASICVSSRVSSAVKSALAEKNRPLRDYMSLSDQQSAQALPLIFGQDPQSKVILEEDIAQIKRAISSLLSRLEQQTLRLYLCGHTYQDMAALLGCSTKAVDNSIQRVRRKLKTVRS